MIIVGTTRSVRTSKIRSSIRLLARQGAGLVVAHIEADDWGGETIQFANCFVLRMFPAGTRGEDWRLFRPKTNTPHFVIAEGEVRVHDSGETEADEQG